jgi:hypothetical protein
VTIAVAHHPDWWVAAPAVFLVIGLVTLLVTYPRSKKYSHDFDVIVGEIETHTIHFCWNAWTGRIRISVDGVRVLNRLQVIDWKLQKTYDVPVGDTEHHVVNFVKTRKKLAPGVRAQPVVTYIDGHVVGHA